MSSGMFMCTLHMSFGITVGSAPKAKSVLTSSVVSVESSSDSMTAKARRGTYEKALIVRLDPHRIQSPSVRYLGHSSLSLRTWSVVHSHYRL